MPKDPALLANKMRPINRCKHCGFWLPGFMRGQIQSAWRRMLGLPYFAVICENCKQITGWEKP